MSIITELRLLTGLTAEDLGNLTGLSRSTISMAETDRRELPAAAFVKITHLLQIAETAAPQLLSSPTASHDQMRRHLAKLKVHAVKCHLKAQELQEKLNGYRQQQTCHAVLEATLQQLQTDWKNAVPDDTLWLGHIKARLNSKIRNWERCDIPSLEWEQQRWELEAAAADARVAHISKISDISYTETT